MQEELIRFLLLLFLALDFCLFCVVICFFIPTTTFNDLSPTLKDFYPRSYPSLFLSYLNILEKEPACPFLMLSAKQANYWYHFYNLFGMMRSLNLNLGPPILEASTLPLGYWGGSFKSVTHFPCVLFFYYTQCYTVTSRDFEFYHSGHSKTVSRLELLTTTYIPLGNSACS